MKAQWFGNPGSTCPPEGLKRRRVVPRLVNPSAISQFLIFQSSDTVEMVTVKGKINYLKIIENVKKLAIFSDKLAKVTWKLTMSNRWISPLIMSKPGFKITYFLRNKNYDHHKYHPKKSPNRRVCVDTYSIGSKLAYQKKRPTILYPPDKEINIKFKKYFKWMMELVSHIVILYDSCLWLIYGCMWMISMLHSM